MRPTNLDSLGFKFAIGDVLIHKGMAHIKPYKEESERSFRSLRELMATPETCARFVVTERIAQECPGGVQLKYVAVCCDPRTGGISQPLCLMEEELVLLPGTS